MLYLLQRFFARLNKQERLEGGEGREVAREVREGAREREGGHYLPWVQESGMKNKVGKNQSFHKGGHSYSACQDAGTVWGHNCLTCQLGVEVHMVVEGPHHSMEMVCAHIHPLLQEVPFSVTKSINKKVNQQTQ